MIFKSLSVVFVGLILFLLGSASVYAQSKADTIKTKVEKRLRDNKKSVVVEKIDGTKLKGEITQASDDSFTILDRKTNQSTVIVYRDTAKVKGSGWPTSAKIALGVGIASAATLTVLYVAFQNATRDN